MKKFEKKEVKKNDEIVKIFVDKEGEILLKEKTRVGTEDKVATIKE